MPVAYFFPLLTASDNTHRKPDSSPSPWMIAESSELHRSIWFPATLCFLFEGLSLPFPADEKFTGAIPAKLANLSTLENHLMSPISKSSFATVVSLTPDFTMLKQDVDYLEAMMLENKLNDQYPQLNL